MQPFFLEASSGRLFAIQFGPADARAAVLVVPALCEEMNRCRQTVSQFARRAADRGIATLIVDLYGTGDSDGEFGDATWAIWRDDLHAAIDWMSAQQLPEPHLLAVRAGCLMASELATSSVHQFSSLILWQPVPTGKAVVRELLRMRIAGELAAGGGGGLAELRAELDGGSAVETGGYELASELALPLETVNLARSDAALPDCLWLEISGGTTPVRPLASNITKQLQEGGSVVALEQVTDPPFWSTAETTLGNATVAASLNFLDGRL